MWRTDRVVEAVLKVSICEIRRGLEDRTKVARLIEPVSTRGYRFLAQVTIQDYGDNNGEAVVKTASGSARVTSGDASSANLPTVIEDRRNPMWTSAAPRTASLLLQIVDEAQGSNIRLCSLLKSAQRAIYRRAYKNAASYCSKAVEMLPSLPDSSQRDKLEVGLRVLIGVLLGTVEGPFSTSVRDVFVCAEQLLPRLAAHCFCASWCRSCFLSSLISRS